MEKVREIWHESIPVIVGSKFRRCHRTDHYPNPRSPNSTSMPTGVSVPLPLLRSFPHLPRRTSSHFDPPRNPRPITSLLLRMYKRKLRGVIEAAPA